MTYTVDRFEGEFAVLETEDRTTIQVPRANLPPSAKEGSVLVNDAGKWAVSDPKTAEKARRIRTKVNLLWK